MAQKSHGHTPMMAQYFAMKEQYPDCFLFYRLGDFYELFDEDARVVSQLLELTLTSRNKNAENPMPMCGVPHHAAAEYIRTLVEKGYKVAICEQMEDPKQTKGMVQREVVQVVTPGTLMDSKGRVDKRNHYLVCVHFCSGAYHLASVDVATGELRVASLTDIEALRNELAVLQAHEWVLLTHAAAEWAEPLAARYGATLSYQLNQEDLSTCAAVMAPIQDNAAQQTVVAGLLAYLFATQKRTLAHLQSVVSYVPEHYLVLDHSAQYHLELTESARSQQTKGSLLWLLDETKTAMGGRLLRRWMEQPLVHRPTIEQRHAQVGSLMTHYFERVDLMTCLKSVYDLERLVGRVSFGSANARDLVQLRQSLQQIPTIRLLVSALQPSAVWQSLADALDPLTEVTEAIERAIQDDPPLATKEGGMIRAGYNDTLDRYRDAMQNGKQWLAALQQQERDRTGIKTLKIGFNRVFGYYIEVSKAQLANKALDGYERKQTLANAERFVTAELKEKERLILEAEDKSIQLEYTLFCELRDMVKQHSARLQALAKVVASLDVLQSFATVSERYHYVQPEFSTDEQRIIDIEAGRHPVVEKVLGTSHYVPNDLHMPEDQMILLITGPNMSGKSTFMRQIALTVIMAQMGCFVPATRARLPIFDRIFTRIGAADDLSAGQSTFMVEMVETNLALRHATERSLLLFDEIGRGTATFDGMALAEAILRYVHQHVAAKALFSTHYHELTVLEEELSGLHNVHVGAVEREGQLVFLHQLMHGPADKSYGLHVAQLAGLPEQLIQNAQVILHRLEQQAPQPLRQTPPPVSAQLETPPRVSQVISALKQVDVTQITPLALMNLVADWQQQLKR